MKVKRAQSNSFVGVAAVLAAIFVLAIAGQALAQGTPPVPPPPTMQPAPQPQWGAVAPPPPPPPPPGTGKVSVPPPPPPPPPPPAPGKGAAPATAPTTAPPPPPGVTTAPPAAATPALDPIKEREIIDSIVEGKRAVGALDLATARLEFEEAFAKCDEYQVKGKLLARVYMTLGALYVGFLQAVPQGTEFMRLALTTDPTVEPERELMNDSVTATFTMVRERLGIVGPAKMDQAGGGGQGTPGGFWVMKHNRILQAKRMYPLGIYMETNPMVAVQSARLYFRLPSDQTYQVAEMQRNKNMYGLLIGCDAIALLDPEAIYYYIEVVGGDGSIIAAEGSLSAPIEIQMIDDTVFQGVQPNLPGLPEPKKCNPDDAAPCPPWDLHCHDIPCATNEDCVGGKVCNQGYCVVGGEGGGGEGESGGINALGLSLFAGLGMGVGIVGGRSETVHDATYNVDHEINLASGLSPSWMFMRLGLGWLFLERFELGAWARLQNISSDSMKFAGMGSKETNGPMWGLYGSFYYFGDGKLMGPGQLVGEDKKLKDKQGLRLYAKIEFDFFGATYHEIKLTYTRTQSGSSEDVSIKRQRASGMQALGLGPGILYGVHKYIDIGGELMYDYVGMGTQTWAHNFDLWLFLRAHF
jgi:hypothetical protein